MFSRLRIAMIWALFVASMVALGLSFIPTPPRYSPFHFVNRPEVGLSVTVGDGTMRIGYSYGYPFSPNGSFPTTVIEWLGALNRPPVGFICRRCSQPVASHRVECEWKRLSNSSPPNWSEEKEIDMGIVSWDACNSYNWRIASVTVSLAPLSAVLGCYPILVFLLRGHFRRIRRRRRGECERCGYRLTGNTSGVCPECGTPFLSNSTTIS